MAKVQSGNGKKVEVKSESNWNSYVRPCKELGYYLSEWGAISGFGAEK